VDRFECYQPLAQINCIGNVFEKSLDILSTRFMQLQGDENGRSKEKSSRGMSRNCDYKLSKQLNTCDWKCITKALPSKPVAVLGADHSNRGSCSLQEYQALLTAESHHRRFGV
jgi:hypothetical protein